MTSRSSGVRSPAVPAPETRPTARPVSPERAAGLVASGGPIGAEGLLALQRYAGNSATTSIVARTSTAPAADTTSPTTSASTATAAPALRSPEHGGAAPGPTDSYLTFERAAQANIEAIGTDAERIARQAEAGGAAESRSVGSRIAGQKARLVARTERAVNSARAVGLRAATGLRSARGRRLAVLATAARSHSHTVNSTTQELAERLWGAAGSHATAAEKAGRDTARLAYDGTSARLGQVDAIRERKLSRYLGEGEDKKIKAMIGKHHGKTWEAVQLAGNELIRSSQEQGNRAGAGFRDKASEQIAQLRDGAARANARIRAIQVATAARIRGRTERAISRLADRQRRRIAQVRARAREGYSALDRAQRASGRSLARGGTTTARAVKRQAAGAKRRLRSSLATIRRRFATRRGSAYREVLDEAREKFVGARADFREAGSDLAGKTRSTLADGGDTAAGAVRAVVDDIVARPAGNGDAAVSKFVASGDAQMARAVGSAGAAMTRVRTTTARGQSRAYQRSVSSWSGKVSRVRSTLRTALSSTTAKQDAVIRKLEPAIDKDAETILQPWYEDAVEFVGGLLSGAAQALWQMAKSIGRAIQAVVGWVVDHIVAVIVAIVVAVVAVVLLALAGVLAAVVGAIAAVVGAVLAVVAAVGLVVAAFQLGMGIGKAILARDASAWERGRLVGGPLAGLLAEIVPGKAVKSVADWTAGGKSVDEAASVTQAGKLDELLPDPNTRGPLLAATKGDAGLLEELLAKAGDDPALLQRLLDRAGNPYVVERLLGKVKSPAHLEPMLAVASPAEIEMLLKAVPSSGRLASMLTMTGDAALLTRLLKVGGSPARLHLYLKQAGPTQAENLLYVLKRSRTPDAAADFVALGRGDPGTFSEMADQLRHFRGLKIDPSAREPLRIRVKVNGKPITQAHLGHIRSRHDPSTFSFAIKDLNTMVALPRSEAAWLSLVHSVLANLRAEGRLDEFVATGTPRPLVVWAQGVEWQIGIRGTANGTWEVGQFSPRVDSPGTFEPPVARLRAIKKLLGR